MPRLLIGSCKAIGRTVSVRSAEQPVGIRVGRFGNPTYDYVQASHARRMKNCLKKHA